MGYIFAVNSIYAGLSSFKF